KLRTFITAVTTYYFEEILSHKGFYGEFIVNFSDVINENGKRQKGQKLDIVIRPRNEQQFRGDGSEDEVATYSSTKSLSGGERSYSTVAFIIAFWYTCSSPFKHLDEVDVIMDMVTRKIAIDTMIEFAYFKYSKQYIFLSPLHIQQIHSPVCV